VQALPDGKYWDQLQRGDGRLLDYGWRSNIIVDQCRELLAAFMLGAPSQGIQHLDLGRGQAIWDSVPPAAPTAGTQALQDASPVVVALADLQIDYLTPAGVPSAQLSNRIQITLTLGPGSLPIVGDETFPLREFALFGTLNGSDYMIDYVRHPVMNIAANDTLTRRIRLVF
jgi:hypothetical protein